MVDCCWACIASYWMRYLSFYSSAVTDLASGRRILEQLLQFYTNYVFNDALSRCGVLFVRLVLSAMQWKESAFSCIFVFSKTHWADAMCTRKAKFGTATTKLPLPKILQHAHLLVSFMACAPLAEMSRKMKALSRWTAAKAHIPEICKIRFSGRVLTQFASRWNRCLMLKTQHS